MRVRDDERGVARVRREERIAARTPPLDGGVERGEQLRRRRALDRDGDASFIELDEHEGQRCPARSAHLRLVADRDDVAARAVGAKCIRQYRGDDLQGGHRLLDRQHLLEGLLADSVEWLRGDSGGADGHEIGVGTGELVAGGVDAIGEVLQSGEVDGAVGEDLGAVRLAGEVAVQGDEVAGG